MAFHITELCTAPRLTPPQKAVLMRHANYAHDGGLDWHSIGAVMEWTRLSKKAVIEAIKAPESPGLIERIHRGNGLNSMTQLKLDAIQARSTSSARSKPGWGRPISLPERYRGCGLR